MSRGTHYVNNKELLAAIVEYKKDHEQAAKDGKEPPRVPENIGRMIWLICERLGNRWNFVNYTYKDEMVAEAAMNCVGAVVKFNPKKSSNPHAYFTMCAWRAMIRTIGKEQKQHAIKHKNLEHMDVLFDEVMPAKSAGGIGTDSRSSSDGMRRHYEVIEKYEEKLTKKKLTKEEGKPKKAAKGKTGGKDEKKRPAATGSKRPARKAGKSA